MDTKAKLEDTSQQLQATSHNLVQTKVQLASTEVSLQQTQEERDEKEYLVSRHVKSEKVLLDEAQQVFMQLPIIVSYNFSIHACVANKRVEAQYPRC